MRDLFGLLDHGTFRSAADPVGLPQLEPGAVRQRFIVPTIRRGDIGLLERTDIRSFKHLLELLDFVNYAFDVHRQQYSESALRRHFAVRVGRYICTHFRFAKICRECDKRPVAGALFLTICLWSCAELIAGEQRL